MNDISNLADIGRGVVIGDNVTIEAFVSIMGTTKIGDNCFIRRGAIIYDDVIIGSNCTVGHGAIIRSGAIIEKNVSIGNLNQIEGECVIGEGTRFHSNVHIAQFSKVGKRCFIAPGFVSTNTPHPFCPHYITTCIKGVTLEDDVKIGCNVSTVPGVTIGHGSLIGIGAVITKDMPAEMVIVGFPAKPVCSIYKLKCHIVDNQKPYMV